MAKRLLIRVDDMGSSWAANEGCVQACQEGIARSVEVMVPCAWLEHAATLLQKHSHIDVGIHLTLSSEWDHIKWRPLTSAPSLTDDCGNFLPLLMSRPDDTRPALQQTNWKLNEIAAEFGAQIETGMRLLPNVTHVSSHMVRHYSDFDPTLGNLVTDLCSQYGLRNDLVDTEVSAFKGYSKLPIEAELRQAQFIAELSALEEGDHIFVDHPALDTPEMRATGHVGYRDVQEDRTSCLRVLTSKPVREAIQNNGIELINYTAL